MILDKLLVYCMSHEEFEAGQRYGGLILRYDRARERTHQLLMRLHYLAGDRTGALRQYERCVVALREELGVRPDRRTVALYEEIRGSQGNAPFDEMLTFDASTSLLEVLCRLKQLQAIRSRSTARQARHQGGRTRTRALQTVNVAKSAKAQTVRRRHRIKCTGAFLCFFVTPLKYFQTEAQIDAQEDAVETLPEHRAWYAGYLSRNGDRSRLKNLHRASLTQSTQRHVRLR